MLFARQAQGFRALWCRCLKPRTLNPWKGCKFHATEMLLAGIISRCSYRSSYASAHLFRGRRNTCEAYTWKSLEKGIVILTPSVCSTCHFWRKSRRNVLFLIFKAWFLKKVSQKCFVSGLQPLIFEGNLGEMLRFWSSKLHFWGWSRKNASFFIQIGLLKEVL